MLSHSFARLAIWAALVASAAGGKLVLDTAKGTTRTLVVKPSADRVWKLGKVDLGGEYSWDEARFAPKAVSMTLKESISRVPYVAKLTVRRPFSKKPKPVANLVVGTDATVKVEVDSTSPVPKKVSTRAAGHGVTVEPSWMPRKLKDPSKGLELKTKLELGGKRSIVLATLAPRKRPKCEFVFELDAQGLTRLHLEPLLGNKGQLTRYEVERTMTGPVRQVSAALFDEALSFKAKVPVSLAKLRLPAVRGALTPRVVVPIKEPTKVRFGISQQIDI